MEHLPPYVGIVFAMTTLLSVWLFYRATPKSARSLTVLLVWATVQSIIGLTGFYTVADTMPPRLVLVLLPPLLLIVGLFATRKGRAFVDSLDLKMLTWLHTVRVPVEIVLFWLFVHKQVPQLMTFEGRNIDIVSGLTAPVIAWFVFDKQRLGSKTLLLWNFVCLGFLFNIVFYGVLSVPTQFQQFAFEQPNIGLMYTPFLLLPGLVVPLVLFAHLAAIRQLLAKNV